MKELENEKTLIINGNYTRLEEITIKYIKEMKDACSFPEYPTGGPISSPEYRKQQTKKFCNKWNRKIK